MHHLILLLLSFVFVVDNLHAQDLPKWLTPDEKQQMPFYLSNFEQNRSAANAPAFAVRNMAEWEEVEFLVITWTSYIATLREIVRHAREECKVIIVCSDSNQVKNNLTAGNVPLSNIMYMHIPFNSIWIRDYFGNTAYKNDVDSMIMVDWVYNRPRLNDDKVAHHVAANLNIPLFETAVNPDRLVATGGNYMSDGLGTGFSSRLILDENSDKNESQIDAIMNEYLGLNTYIKMTNLPYDDIHHIDMHMKLMNEETLLVGEYPEGISDGPQIEANINYVLSNFTTAYGNPFTIKRIPMPPSATGTWPSQGAYYRTYANMVFINKTILVPVYSLSSDSAALETIRQLMPGYKVVGINCSQIISQGGAIHCITHTIGVNEPLLINHKQIANSSNTTSAYIAEAQIKHISGISSATLYYRTDTLQAYQSITMQLQNALTDTWSASIPAQQAGTTVYYYIEATANNSKQMQRPLTAPQGYYHFSILDVTTVNENGLNASTLRLYPNPAKAITVLELELSKAEILDVYLLNIHGQLVKTIANQQHAVAGKTQLFFDVSDLASGIYAVQIKTVEKTLTQKLVVK